MKIDLYKNVDLSYLGEGWGECYLKFSPLTISEAQELSKIKNASDDEEIITKATNILESKFIEGKVLSDGKVTDLPKDEVKNLPIELIVESMNVLSAGLDAKKKNQSMTPSEVSPEPNPQ